MKYTILWDYRGTRHQCSMDNIETALILMAALWDLDVAPTLWQGATAITVIRKAIR